MIVAVVGVVGVVAVIGSRYDDHRNHSNHRNYPDSSVKDKIARLEAESKDLERSVERFISGEVSSSVKDFFSFLRSNPQFAIMIGNEIGDIQIESLEDIEKNLKKISNVLVKELQKEIDSERQRLESIDETLRRINNIELK